MAAPEKDIHHIEDMAHHGEKIAHDIHASAHHAAEHGAHGAHHEPHALPTFINFLNDKFGDNPFISFLYHWETFIFSSFVVIGMIALFSAAAKRDSLIPSGVRNLVEMIVEAFEDFVVGICGEHGRKHVPFIGTLFLYILLLNWSGLIPFSKAPTAYWSTTISLALIALVYIHWAGISALGFGNYLHHMAGSPASLIPWIIGVILIFPLNLILELGAVPFSLSLRLFANISSEDRLLYKFAVLNAETNYIPILLQLFANILAVLFSIIQAFVFTLLTTVYISTLMPHDDHDHAHEEAEHAHA